MTQNKPCIDDSTFVDKTAVVIGKVTVGKNCGIFPYSVIRGDQNAITIDDGSNIQDGCIIHVNDEFKTTIGKHVSLGHGAIVHGSTIEDECIIGMHATILNGAVIKKGSIIGANALVTSGATIPENSLVLGVPGKVIKQDEIYREQAKKNAETYIRLSKEHKEQIYQKYE